MADQTTVGAPVEYFFWRRSDQNNVQNTVVGNRVAVEADPGGIVDPFSMFDSSIKSIRRSTGGRVLVEPIQIVFFDEEESRRMGKPAARIKVRFRDFRVARGESLSDGQLVMHTKVVTADQLEEPFPFDLDGPRMQSYVMDFGQGIIPVHVVRFYESATGSMMADFIELHDVAKHLRSEEKSSSEIQVYRVERDVLRLAEVETIRGRSEYDFAKENYARLKSMNNNVIPMGLALGRPIRVEPCRGVHEIRLQLRQSLVKSKKMVTPSVPKPKETGKKAGFLEGLFPFGLFER